MLVDTAGNSLTTWSSAAKKIGRRYRYCINLRDTKEFAGASGLPRFPAAELEAAVVEQLRHILRAPSLMQLIAVTATKSGHALDETQVTVALTRIDTIW